MDQTQKIEEVPALEQGFAIIMENLGVKAVYPVEGDSAQYSKEYNSKPENDLSGSLEFASPIVLFDRYTFLKSELLNTFINSENSDKKMVMAIIIPGGLYVTYNLTDVYGKHVLLESAARSMELIDYRGRKDCAAFEIRKEGSIIKIDYFLRESHNGERMQPLSSEERFSCKEEIKYIKNSIVESGHSVELSVFED